MTSSMRADYVDAEVVKDGIDYVRKPEDLRLCRKSLRPGEMTGLSGHRNRRT
jgi:hypothetical protein